KTRTGRAPMRELGEHPEDKEPVNIMNGRFGPYIKYKKVNASLPSGTAVEDVTMEQALELIAERAAKMAEGGGGRKKAAKKTSKKKAAKKKVTKKATKKTAKKASKKKVATKKTAASKTSKKVVGDKSPAVSADS